MNRRVLPGLVLALAVSISFSLAPPAGAERFVVSPTNMQGWVIGIQQGVNGGWDPPYVPQPAEMPIADFVYGPGQPPAGDGSLHMQVFYSDNDPLSKVYIGTNAFSGIELNRITKLKYCTYVQYRDYDRSMPPMVELITDSGTTVQQRRFWFYPWGENAGPNGAGNVRMGQWQEWDLLDPAGRWEMTFTSTANYYGNWEWLRKWYDPAGESMKLQTPYVGDYRDGYDASWRVGNPSGTSLSIKIGSGKVYERQDDGRNDAWWHEQSGVFAYVDKLIIGIDGVDYEYDFEVGSLPTVAINNKAAGDPIMAQAKDNFKFTVFGRVDFTDFTSDTFRVDDGSGNPILVKAQNHGVNPFEYVRATGRLVPNTTPPSLDSLAESIEKLEAY